MWNDICERATQDTTRPGIEFWLFGYGISDDDGIVSETRVTGLWRIADGRWARPIKLIIHLLQPGGKFKLVLKNSPANGLAKRIGFSKLTTPVKLDGRGPPPSTPAPSPRLILSRDQFTRRHCVLSTAMMTDFQPCGFVEIRWFLPEEYTRKRYILRGWTNTRNFITFAIFQFSNAFSKTTIDNKTKFEGNK